MSHDRHFANLEILAKQFRAELERKKFILLYAYNGTGKTRLSTAFKDLGKTADFESESAVRDTLYFNAFTEDLFSWDNDLARDSERKLKINAESKFLFGLDTMELETRIRGLLERYADFEFRLDTSVWEAVFFREHKEKISSAAGTRGGKAADGRSEKPGETHGESVGENAIKVSRSEENIFVWCFFLAIVEHVFENPISRPYGQLKYIYIDDPISSLDEQNAVAVANHLASVLKGSDIGLKTVISTHHALFFNVLCNEMKEAKKYFLDSDGSPEGLLLRETGDTPFFHHVAALAELCKADQEDRLRTHHFNMFRTILEKTASFHGYKNFSGPFAIRV